VDHKYRRHHQFPCFDSLQKKYNNLYTHLEQELLSIIMIYDNFPCSSTNHSNRRGTVVIVDWDDTILPSTFVDRWQIENSRDLPLHVSRIRKSRENQSFPLHFSIFGTNKTMLFNRSLFRFLENDTKTVSKSLGRASRVCKSISFRSIQIWRGESLLLCGSTS
jgi:hypothetical protein